VRYCVSDLSVFATPAAEGMFEFKGLSSVDFEFPGRVQTVLFIHCGLVRKSRRDSKATDYYEIVGRLYNSANPKAEEEPHVGKLYIRVRGYPNATFFEAECERIEWHADGSFDVIDSEGVRRSVRPPSHECHSQPSYDSSEEETVRYSNVEDEIQHKLTQALAMWRDSGGPASISIKDAVRKFAETHPDVTQDQFENAVLTCPFLELDCDQIRLSEELGDFSPEHPERIYVARGNESRGHSESQNTRGVSQARPSRKYAWIGAILFFYIGYYVSGLDGSIIGAILGWIIGSRIKKLK